MSGVHGKPFETKKVLKWLLESQEDDLITLFLYQ